MPANSRNDDRRPGSERLLDGKYRIGRVLGEGGMGAVYEAEHVGLRIKVAVKLLNEIFTTDESAMGRFQREARAAAAIRHENVVTVTDTGMDAEGVPFIVMELVEGESLSALLRRERVLSPLDAANIACQIGAGLQAAHERGVIHRDLKPGNVLVRSGPDGYSIKILDFGISKFFADTSEDVTEMGAVVGTPRFMAPEQARAQADLDERVDIYAVGVLLYRMLTGRLPFAGRTQDEVIEQTIAGKVKPPRKLRPEISEALQQVVLKAMALDRVDRYSSASDIVVALHRAVPELQHLRASEELTGGTTSIRPPAARWRMRLLVPLFSVVFTMLGGLVAYWLAPRHQRPQKDKPPAAKNGVETSQAIRFGITRYMPTKQLRAQRAPLVRYLASRLGRPIELVISDDFVDLAAKLARGELQLAALASCDYVRAKRSHPGIKLIASHVTRSGSTYRGYILSRADSGIHRLPDLRNKVFCYTNIKSCSGYVYPRVLFRRHGMDPDRAFSHTRFSGDHLRALRALHHKACDGASVYAGLLFEENVHGFAPQDFRIIATTDRIPFDAYCTPRGQPSDLTDALREALLALRPNSGTAREVLGDKSYITGFVVGDDSAYERVPIPPPP